MSRADEVYRALAELGVSLPASFVPDARENGKAARTLVLANALLEAAEKEVIKAEMAVQVTDRIPEDFDALIDEVDDTDTTSHWALGLLQWRAARLHQVLERCLEGRDDVDPLLIAAGDAATLTMTLVCYRESSELLMTNEKVEPWQDIPATALMLAITLVDRITVNLRDLTA